MRTHNVSLDEVPPSVIDNCLIQFRRNKCQLSLIYGRLLAAISPSTKLIREEWEREIGVGISEEIWQSGLEDIDKQSVNTRLCLIQFEVLDYTSLKINYIGFSPMSLLFVINANQRMLI